MWRYNKLALLYGSGMIIVLCLRQFYFMKPGESLGPLTGSKLDIGNLIYLIIHCGSAIYFIYMLRTLGKARKTPNERPTILTQLFLLIVAILPFAFWAIL